ncbi:hypothetical protein ACNKHT_21965 [Shigella flexneri]
MSRWCVRKMRAANTCGHILSQLPHLQLPTLEKLGLINALGHARRYPAVRFRNLGRGRAAT